MKTLKKKPLTFRLDVVEVNHQEEKEWEILHFSNVEWFS